jgi:hypothetical protein
VTITGHPRERSSGRGAPWWRLHWWELFPELALGVGLLIFFVQQNDAATSAFKSGRAVTLMVLTALAWLVARAALARFVRWPALRAGVLSVGALGILAVVVLPAYDDTTVVETFPGPAAAPPPTTTAGPTTTTSPTNAAPAASTAPAAPVRLRVSMFRGVDHRASGTVAIYRQPDGRFVVGLEEFDIQPGPDYDLYVVPGDNRTNRTGGARLDDLRGNRGTQYYDVPASIDLNSGPWSVLVWCQTFGVPVATATPI